MDISQRNNESTQQVARQAQSAQTAQPKFERANNFSNGKQSSGMMMGSKRMVICFVLVIVAILVILCGCMWARNAFFSNEGAINTNQFQAVFLTNGQVYFGKLSSVDNGYAKLTQIYYLQVQQQVQPSNDKNSSQQPQVSLTKLGNELHGPEDSMYVARDQILFWENLKSNGKVATAIKQYEQQNNK